MGLIKTGMMLYGAHLITKRLVPDPKESHPQNSSPPPAAGYNQHYGPSQPPVGYPQQYQQYPAHPSQYPPQPSQYPPQPSQYPPHPSQYPPQQYQHPGQQETYQPSRNHLPQQPQQQQQLPPPPQYSRHDYGHSGYNEVQQQPIAPHNATKYGVSQPNLMGSSRSGRDGQVWRDEKRRS